MLRSVWGISRLSVAGGAALVACAFAAPPAHAQFWEQLFVTEPERPRKIRPALPRKQPSEQRDAAVEPQIKSTQFPLVAVVSIASQRLAIYDSTGAVLHSRVSTGQQGHRTPLGVFKVIQKDRYHESNIYSGAPMPFMQRITWSGIAMHAGHLPGYPASHGCIRMPEEVASELFGATKLGMLVVVSPSDVAPVPFSHPALPIPLMLPASPTISRPEPVQPQQSSNLPSVQVTLASDTGAIGNAPAATLTNPHVRAVEELPRARKAAAEAVKLVKVALEASQLASMEANTAVADLRAVVGDLTSALRKLAVAHDAEATAATMEARMTATKAVSEAEARHAEFTKRHTEVKAVEATKTQQAFDAADAWRAADALVESTAEAARVAAKAVEPLSVFIRRKEGRLFVRQGFRPLFDAPVTFRGAEPLGTHVFTVMAADEQSGLLGWQSISIPSSSNAARAPAAGRKDQSVPQSVSEVATAAEALDRVEMDLKVRQKLGERVWFGASLIVSDHGLGDETGTDTDFVVLTR